MVGYNPVVDIHGEQRGGENKKIDDYRGDEDAGIKLRGPLQGAPEPMVLMRTGRTDGAFLALVGCLQQEREAEVLLTQSLERDPLLTLPDIGKNDFGDLVVVVDGLHDAGVTSPKNEDARQQQVGQVVEVSLHQPGGKSRALGHPGKQAFGIADRKKLRSGSSWSGGKTSDQRINRDRPVIKAREQHQTLQQRVVVMFSRHVSPSPKCHQMASAIAIK